MNINPSPTDQQFYLEGEQYLCSFLLKNMFVDDITSKVKDIYFVNAFYQQVFRVAYNYSVTLGQGTVDYNTVCHQLQMGGLQMTPEVAQALQGLYHGDVTTYPNVDYIIEILRDTTIRRSTIQALQKHLADAQNGTIDIHKILNEVEDSVSLVQQDTDNGVDLVLPSELEARRKAGVIERYHTRGFYTGWEPMDKYLSVGFAPGKVSVIAGRTSMGKSFFKTNLMSNMCNIDIGVVNVCPEQGFDSEQDRIDAITTGISLKSIARLREWAPDDIKFKHLKNSSLHIGENWDYSVVPSRKITVAGIRTAIRRIKRAGVKANVVFIDLFDRLSDVNVAKDKTGTIAVKLHEIEVLAEEESVHICLLVQVNRGTEGRKDKRPSVADLRDSGSFEQDADLIMLLYREGYYNDEIEDNILEVNIAKQRDGLANITMQFMMVDKDTLAIVPIGKKEPAPQQPQQQN